MCGRYTDEAELSDIRLTFKVEEVELFRDWKPTYNITPSYGPGFEQPMLVRTREGARRLTLGRFWFIPPGWQKPLKSLPTSFNARAEDIEKKPLWREAFRSARCLVPATGWREFSGSAGKKQPFHFHFDHRLFAFAGLSSRFTSPEGEVVDSFAIITTAANQNVVAIHDRMPLALSPAAQDAWLDPTSDPRAVLDQACAASVGLAIDVYPSDPIGNSGRYEGPQAIARITAPIELPKAPPVQGELFGTAPAARRRSRR